MLKGKNWRQKIFKNDQTFMQEEKKLMLNILSGVDNLFAGGKNLRQNTLPGVGSMASLFTGGEELEAEYFAWRRQQVSKTYQSLYTKEKNWRQTILPGVSSMSPRPIKPLYRKGRTGGRISCQALAASLRN